MWMNTQTLAILIPILPLLGAALVGIVGLRGLEDRSHWLVLLGSGLSLMCAIAVYFRVSAHLTDPHAFPELSRPIDVYSWFSTGFSWLSVSFHIDSLTSVMLLTVTFVAFLVVVYSVGYMRDHHG